jgi:hypothetical protein
LNYHWENCPIFITCATWFQILEEIFLQLKIVSIVANNNFELQKLFANDNFSSSEMLQNQCVHWKLSNNMKNLSFKFDNLHLWSMNEISRLDIKILLVIYKHFHQTIKCYIWLCVTTFVKHFSKNAYLQKIQCIETKTTFATWFFASWQNSLQNVSSKKLEGKFELAIAQTHGECLH